jgi:hypothetical protein
MVVYRIAFAGPIVFAFGCFSSGPPQDPAVASYLSQQIRNSRKIPDDNARASAMVSIARSAAFRDDMDHFNMAMRELRGDPRHDDTAAQCATFLADAGKVDTAKKVAKKIEDPARKQELLDKFSGKSDAAKPDTIPK